MILAQISHGLGNQLFQYAMGRALAARRGAALKLDLSWFRAPQEVPGLEAFTRAYKLGHFQIDAPAATAQEIARFTPAPLSRFDPRRLRGPWWRLRRRFPRLCAGMTVLERGMNFEPGLLDLPDGVSLRGWWQSEAYFADQAGLIRRELALRDEALRAEAGEFVAQRRNGGKPVVSVHVRRGDVARAHETLGDLSHMPYELVSEDYLRRAMTHFGDEATFLVFSDTAADIAWCRERLRARDIHFAEGGSDLRDFAVMSGCDHHIISNSSFGWWAAWLNPRADKTVIAPRAWFRREFAPEHDIRSLAPGGWIVL